MEKIPVYQIDIDLSPTQPTGVDRVSFVEFPAIESNFVALSGGGGLQLSEVNRILKTVNEPTKLSSDGMRQEVTGPALIPDKDILRWDALKKEFYYIRFSAKVIAKIRDKFFREHFQNNTNQEHAIPLAGNTVVESWIVENPELDKSAALGMPQVKGTWMVTVKVADKDFFEKEILSGRRKGFSIEGYFDHIEVEFNKPNKNTMSKKVSFLHRIVAMFTGAIKSELGIKTLKDGKQIDVDDETQVPYYVDDEGVRGEVVADGEYTLEDDSAITVKDGKVEATTDPVEDPEEDEAETEAAALGAFLSAQIDLKATSARSRDTIIYEMSVKSGLGIVATAAFISGAGETPNEAQLTAMAGVLGITRDSFPAQTADQATAFALSAWKQVKDFLGTVTSAQADAKVSANPAGFRNAILKAASPAVSGKRKLSMGRKQITKEEKESLGAFVKDDGKFLFIFPGTGEVLKVSDNLWIEGPADLGVHTLHDGRKVTVIEGPAQVFCEGTDWEFEFIPHIIDIKASDLTVEEIVPWLKDNMSAIKTLVDGKLKASLAEVTALKADIAALRKQPGAAPVVVPPPAGGGIIKMNEAQEKLEAKTQKTIANLNKVNNFFKTR